MTKTLICRWTYFQIITACNVIKMTHKANSFSSAKCKILVAKEKLIYSKAYLKLEATCISACLFLLSSVVLLLFEWNPCYNLWLFSEIM